ncbi:mucin-binding protein [Alloscardovia macacae]|uniref:Cell wall surface anchor protein n=1 Tax=Alloscardovia macacae TaxID=1160091 RepID=A0A261F3L5_9BIFI|nr:G5 domain-containing protein [Alloscardovia macacae]OZG53704.1 cell wall surface anchor protein [Alloscardovia macacae]
MKLRERRRRAVGYGVVLAILCAGLTVGPVSSGMTGGVWRGVPSAYAAETGENTPSAGVRTQGVDLAVEMSGGSGSVLMGSKLENHITVKNTGTKDVSDAELSVKLDNGAQNSEVDLICTHVDDGVPYVKEVKKTDGEDHGAQTFSARISLPAGKSMVFTLYGRYPFEISQEQSRITATVSASQDVLPGNNSVTSEFRISTGNEPEISVQQTKKSFTYGEVQHYTVTYTNTTDRDSYVNGRAVSGLKLTNLPNMEENGYITFHTECTTTGKAICRLLEKTLTRRFHTDAWGIETEAFEDNNLYGGGTEVLNNFISIPARSSLTFDIDMKLMLPCGIQKDHVQIQHSVFFIQNGDTQGAEHLHESLRSGNGTDSVTSQLDVLHECVDDRDIEISQKVENPETSDSPSRVTTVTFTNTSGRDLKNVPVYDQFYLSDDDHGDFSAMKNHFSTDATYMMTCTAVGGAVCPAWASQKRQRIPDAQFETNLDELKGRSLIGGTEQKLDLPAGSSITLIIPVSVDLTCGGASLYYAIGLHPQLVSDLDEYNADPTHEEKTGHVHVDTACNVRPVKEESHVDKHKAVRGESVTYTYTYTNDGDSDTTLYLGDKLEGRPLNYSYTADLVCETRGETVCPFTHKKVNSDTAWNADFRDIDWIHTYWNRESTLLWNDLPRRVQLKGHSQMRISMTVHPVFSCPLGGVFTLAHGIEDFGETYNPLKTTFICNSPSISAAASTQSPKRGEDVVLSSTVRNSAGFVRNAPLSLTVPMYGLSLKDPSAKPSCVSHSGAQCPSDWMWDTSKGVMTGSVPFLPIGGSLDVSLVVVADKDLPKASYDLVTRIDALGDVDSSDNVARVPVEYGWTAGHVSARYVQVKADNTQSDIVDPVKLDTRVGDSYEAKSLDEGKVPEGYRLAFMPDNARGTLSSTDRVSVVFYYIPKDASEQSSVGFETRFEADSSLGYGVQKVKTEGQEGKSEKVTTYSFNHDENNLQSTSAQRTVSRPVTRVVGVGNRESKTVMRVVHFRDRATNAKVADDQKDTATVEHSARVNAQSGVLEGDSWSSGVWPVVRVPSSERYVRSIADVPGLSDSSATEDTEFTVWFDHAVVSVEQKQSYTRRIHFIDKVTGKKLKDDVVQTVELTRVNEKDLATSEVSEGAWSEGLFAKLALDPVEGYTASLESVAEAKAIEDTEVTVEYAPVAEPVTEVPTVNTGTPEKKPVLAKTGVNVATGLVLILLLSTAGVTLQMRRREHTK